MFFFRNESANVDEQRHLAAVEADSLRAQLLPDYPGDREISTVDDVHEAAVQIDLSKKLGSYYMDVVVWHQATAHDELQGMEWYEEQKAQEHYDRARQIMSMIPDQPR